MKTTVLPWVARDLQDREQTVPFLRSQHSCGLVEDQDLGASIEHLENLDSLTYPDWQRSHPCVRVHLETVVFHQGRDRVMGRPPIENPTASGLAAKHDILGDGKRREQHEVLVHHPQTRSDRIEGAVESAALATDEDLPFIGLCEPVEDVHQGGLAGSVLADQGADFSSLHGQADAIIGDHAGEALGDVA